MPEDVPGVVCASPGRILHVRGLESERGIRMSVIGWDSLAGEEE